MTKRNSAEVIRAAQKGDGEAFQTLYEQNRAHVFALSMKMTKNEATAEDMVQETFMRLYKKIGTFRFESAFSTWLHRLAVNVILMHLRKNKGVAELSLDDALPSSESETAVNASVGVEDKSAEMSAERISLMKAVKALPTGYRLAFVLHDLRGMRHKEIAKVMGCSAGNSKSQLHKARLKLRKALTA